MDHSVLHLEKIILPHKSSPRSTGLAHDRKAVGARSAARGDGGAWARGARGSRSGRRRSRTPNLCRPEKRRCIGRLLYTKRRLFQSESIQLKLNYCRPAREWTVFGLLSSGSR